MSSELLVVVETLTSVQEMVAELDIEGEAPDLGMIAGDALVDEAMGPARQIWAERLGRSATGIPGL